MELFQCGTRVLRTILVHNILLTSLDYYYPINKGFRPYNFLAIFIDIALEYEF